MDVGISYIYERLFIDLVLPFTVFAAWLSLLCSIVAYIVHKMAKTDPKISFKTKLKNCYKWGLSIYLILIVIVLLLVPIFPQEIFHYENITYSHLNSYYVCRRKYQAADRRLSLGKEIFRTVRCREPLRYASRTSTSHGA